MKSIIPSHFSGQLFLSLFFFGYDVSVWLGVDLREYYHVPSMIALTQEVKALPDEGNTFEDWYEDKKAYLNAIEEVHAALFQLKTLG